jgi:S-adenosylmethionine hydrolase
MPRPIALLTDFGYQDAYAGIMKGVIAGRCPAAPLIDITHGIPPQDVMGGAMVLRSAVPYFPADSVFLAVVDPGVGGPRKPICIRSGTRLFVGPDNGLLWLAASSCGEPEAFHLNRPEHWLPAVSSTFHGRDLFAPAAAALSAGLEPGALGDPLSNPVRISIPPVIRNPDGLLGEVIYVDGYGNAVTNLQPDDLGTGGGPYRFKVADRFIFGPANCYSTVQAGEPTISLGSWGYFEVAIRDGDAALLLGLQRASPVSVTFPADRAPV